MSIDGLVHFSPTGLLELMIRRGWTLIFMSPTRVIAPGRWGKFVREITVIYTIARVIIERAVIYSASLVSRRGLVSVATVIITMVAVLLAIH